jgi:hypothetical protein
MKRLSALSALFLAACVAVPGGGPLVLRMPAMVVQPAVPAESAEPVALKGPADTTLVRGINVGEVVVGRETNAVLPVEVDPINEAVLNTLAAHGLLNAGRPRYRLNVTLTSLTLPPLINPLNFYVTAAMAYELVEVATGTTAWTADVASTGVLDGLVTDRTTATRDAAEKAIQANIRDMLGLLYQKPATMQQVEPPLAPVPVPVPVPSPVPPGIPPVDVPMDRGPKP